MQLGPILVYKCPKCKNLISKESLISGNTFGATIYSDGKMNASRCPEYPSIVKCSKCKLIFWLNGKYYIGTEATEFSENILEEYKGIEIERSKFLTFDEYLEALDTLNFETVHEEIFIRQRIWWEFNHRERKDLPFFNSSTEETIWLKNINHLLELFDPNDVHQRILIAELNRHVGNFEDCMDIINKLDDGERWKKYKTYFAEECDKKNTRVFILHSRIPPR